MILILGVEPNLTAYKTVVLTDTLYEYIATKGFEPLTFGL